MNCLEAQSKIIAFIDNKLPDDELREFIKHVRNCDNCAEELEIYYTLIVGTRQLDNEQNLSSNFKKELDKKMDEEMNRMTAVKRIATSTIVIVLAAIIAGLVWTYNGVLDKVYIHEQNTKLLAQSDYYYADTFDRSLVHDYSPYINSLERYLDTSDTAYADYLSPTAEFMNKVSEYNRTHINYREISEVENEEDINN